jgi:EmrB/QacA subfamily drug resistance transporter
VLAVAVIGTFMAFVDATIVNIAIPDIASEFPGAGLSSVSWVLNAYNILLAAFLVAGGQLADLLGRRRVFSLGLLLFTAASAACAAAPTLGLLVAARGLQAVGAALLVPSSLAIVLDAYPLGERTHAVALWAAVAALAAGIGPPLGGLLITASSWRLVFLVNVPVGLLAFMLARRVIVESRAPGVRRMPDLLGGLALALSIGSLVLAVVKGQEWGWASARVLAALALSGVLGAWFLVRSGRHRNPVIEPALLRIRDFDASNGATLVMAGGFYAYTLCNVLFLTSVWRYSILTAGLALTPGPFTAIAVARPASRLAQRVGYRTVAIPGALVWAAGMLYFATVLGTEPRFVEQWLPGMIVLGAGAGLTFPTLSAAAVGSLPGERFAMATALNSVARQIGAALGVAVLIAIIGTPAPAQALDAFREGWLFAAACFGVGALVCVALALRPPSESLADRDPGWQGPAPEPLPLEPAGAELPRLSELAGEHAIVAPQSPAEFLSLVPTFAPLAAGLRAEVAALAHEVSLPAGEWLFREGDPGDGVYVVKVGHLEVLREDPGREHLAINTLTRGAVLGELALLTGAPRSASVRALRDSELLRIGHDEFAALLRGEPALALGLTQALSMQLQASQAAPVERRPRPVTIALVALAGRPPVLEIADELSRSLCRWGRVAVLHAGPQPAEGERPAAASAYAPLIERCEQEHDQVLLVCDPETAPPGWIELCVGHADRVLAAVSPGLAPDPAALAGAPRVPEGSDLLAYAPEPGLGALAPWLQELDPPSVHVVGSGPDRLDVARTARRLAGRAPGIVLSGGGARAFAHLGMLEVLGREGATFDRVAGVSMGAFIGAQLACGRDWQEIDAACYEEWVRRNPINDYTLPRHGLIRGHKARAMLERVFGDVNVEELERPFYCASVNLRGSRLQIERSGPLAEAVGASMSLPLIAPPVRRERELLIDGSLLDNLPLGPMGAAGEGPVLALDVKGGEERPRPPVGAAPRPPRTPSLPETMARVALLSSANTDESARRHASLTIPVRVSGVGLLEFHQIDEAREAGRAAAREALEQPPEWLFEQPTQIQSLQGRRTVLRV